MDKTSLKNLCSRAWSLKALALIANGCPARVSPLAASAGCGRTAMSASVAHLVAMNLLERNPGAGHPLRSEFRLTYSGQAVAEWAAELDSLLRKPTDSLLYRGKWALPVVAALDPVQRYSALKKQLPPVTDRALVICLAKLMDQCWIRRFVCVQSTPPSVSYETLTKGRLVHQHVQLLPTLIVTEQCKSRHL